MTLDDRCPYFVYQAATDFLSLDSVTRFNVGLGLKLVMPFEVLEMETTEADKKIFLGAFKKGLVPEFIKAIYNAKGGIYIGHS